MPNQGHGFAVRSSRPWWWGLGGVVVLVLGLAWAFAPSRTPPIPTPPPAPHQPRAVVPLPARQMAAAPHSGHSEEIAPNAAAALESQNFELRAQLESLQRERDEALANLANSQAQALVQAEEIRDLRERIDNAVAVVRSGNVPRALAPRSAKVRHLGPPKVTPLGTSWLVSGIWYNIGDAEARGTAEIELLVDRRPTGQIQRVTVGPIAPSATAGYQARFDGQIGRDGQVVEARATWLPL